MKLKLEAKTKEQTLVLNYLENNASESLIEKINSGTKTTKDNIELISKKDLNGFMKYANDEARKIAQKGSNYAMVEDNTVFGWAIHYFEEDSIAGNLYNLDGSEYKAKQEIKEQPKIE